MGKKIGITILFVALITLGISVVALRSDRYRTLEGTPTQRIATAIENTNKKMLQEQKKSDTDTIEHLMNRPAKEAYFTLGLGDDTSQLTGYLQMGQDKWKGHLNLASDVTLGLDIYRDGDSVGLDVPQLFDTPYAIKLSTFEEDFKKSSLATLLEMDELVSPSDQEEINQLEVILNAFGDYLKGIQTLKDNQQFIKQTNDLQKEILESLDWQESTTKPDTLTLNTDSSDAPLTFYTATINNEQLADIVKKELNLLLQYDFVKNYFETLAKSVDMTYERFMAEIDNALVLSDQMKIEVTIGVDQHFIRAITVQMYETDKPSLTMAIWYPNGENLTDDVRLTLDVVLDDSSNARLDMNYLYANNAYTNNHTFTLTDSQGHITLNFNTTYDTSNQMKVEMRVSESIGDYCETLRYLAQGTRTLEKDHYEVDLKEGTLTFITNQEEESVAVPLTFGIKKIEDSDILIDSSKATYILEMNEAQLYQAIEAIQNKAFARFFNF